MNIRQQIDRAFLTTRRRPRRVQPGDLLTARRWNDLVMAIEELMNEQDRR